MNILLTNFLRLQSQYPHLAALCLGVIKSSFVIALTSCAAVFLRRHSALARNWVWRCAIIGLLGLTFWQFGPVTLTRNHPVWHVSPAPDVSIGYPQTLRSESSGDVVKTTPPESMRLQTSQRSVLMNGFWDISENNVQMIWCAGIAILLMWRGIRAVAGYYWLKKSASPPVVGLLEAGRRISKLAGLATPPRLAACNSLPTPLLTGWIKPSIFLPADYVQWKREKLDAVLLHEVAHWQRMDGFWQTLAVLTRSIWWWNPLAWHAVAQLKAEAEHAADEMVVTRQHDAPNYAQVLVEIAAAGRQDFSSGIAMVGSSSLERRIREILRDNPWRGKLGALGVGAAIALTCVFLVLGAFYLGAAKASAQSNAPEAKDSSSNSLTREILAAADAGDQKKISSLLNGRDELGIYAAFQAIQLALNTRELRAFTTLDDLFARSAFGKNWKLDDATLRSLVKDGRTDFLDALLARGLDLNRLSAQSGVADKATAAWMTRRIAEVTRQRADIEALCKAANTGDLPAIRRLLATGVDVNCVGKDHNTPLIRAVFKNQLQAAQLLLDHGAQVDKPRYPGWDYTPLCLVNSVPMAELLKKNGANVHARLYGGHSSILTYVAMFAKPDVVAWFLKQGLNPKEVDDDGESLLFELRDADVAKLLLEAGVDPNRTNNDGEPPIATAQNAAVAQVLIEHGARVTGFKKPLLLMMDNNDSFGAMEAVLRAGADHDTITLQSALNEVERFSSEDHRDRDKIIQLLLSYGAKPIPSSAFGPQERGYEIPVSATNGEFTGDGGTSVKEFCSFGDGGTSSQQNIMVQNEGTADIWVRSDAQLIALVAVRKGWAPTFAGPFKPPFDRAFQELKLSLTGGAHASVVIVDEQGEPIAGAQLAVQYPGPPGVDSDTIISNSAGIVALEHIAAAPLNLQVSADGYQADEVDNIRLDPAKPYRWTLKKGQITMGTVTDAATGKPIAGATIRLAGVLGPHTETHGGPADAPLLATSDATGRFTLACMRPDSRYYFFVDAPDHGGQFLQDIEAGEPEWKVVLGPELTIHGRVIHFAHISPDDVSNGEVSGGYGQAFKFGDNTDESDSNIELTPKNDEAEFTINHLYAWPVGFRIGKKVIVVEAKDLPKNDLVIDLDSESAPPGNR